MQRILPHEIIDVRRSDFETVHDLAVLQSGRVDHQDIRERDLLVILRTRIGLEQRYRFRVQTPKMSTDLKMLKHLNVVYKTKIHEQNTYETVFVREMHQPAFFYYFRAPSFRVFHRLYYSL